MPILNNLPIKEKEHWLLHLNAVAKDTPTLSKTVEAIIKSGALPNIKHPAYIHDWLERPETRPELEALNG